MLTKIDIERQRAEYIQRAKDLRNREKAHAMKTLEARNSIVEERRRSNFNQRESSRRSLEIMRKSVIFAKKLNQMDVLKERH